MTFATLTDLRAHLLEIAARALELDNADTLRASEPPEGQDADLAIACHQAAKAAGLKPDAAAEKIAGALSADTSVLDAQSARGFCNLRLAPAGLWQTVQAGRRHPERFGHQPDLQPERWIIEFSSPNTNKPLHIGHLRNTILGNALSNLVRLYGHTVFKYNIINDRGIHICKSMVAYDRFGENSTPQETGEKGDKFVGRYYSLFDAKATEEFDAWTQGPGKQALAEFREREADKIANAADLKLRRQFLDEQVAAGTKLSFKPKKKKPTQYAELMAKDGLETAYQDWRQQQDAARRELESSEGMSLFLKESARRFEAETSTLHAQSRDFLQRWEAKDPAIRELWKTMNSWVLAGINATYERLNIEFDQIDYESNTYLLGKELVQELVTQGVAKQRDDGAIIAEIPAPNPSQPPLEKVLLRADGTSVYITQDLGTFWTRFEQRQPDFMVYVVGSEQELHFQNLFALIEKLKPGVGKHCAHLSYGMVELPHGKMKSRQGIIVEADEFLDDVHAAAERIQRDAERQSTQGASMAAQDLSQRAEVIAMAAVKYHLLKYSKTSTVKFDIEDALDLTGKTGPYCLYAVARIRSILRKVREQGVSTDLPKDLPLPAIAATETRLLHLVAKFPEVVAQAVRDLEPFHIADYAYRLAKSFSSYFSAKDGSGAAQFPVAMEPDPALRCFRIALVQLVETALENSLRTLGIETLEEM